MAERAPSDLFGQPDKFGPAPPPSYLPDPAKVRAEAAPAVPWKVADRDFYRTVFPQMTNWLPVDEAQQLRFQFETELARLLEAA